MKLSQILPLVVGGAVAGMVVSGASPAQALTYNFSFLNEDGPVAGSVGGTIVLPDGDGTFAASSVIVNSAPAALGYTLPFDVLANLTNVLENTFTVTGGAIDPSISRFSAFFSPASNPSLGSSFGINSTSFIPGSSMNVQLTTDPFTGVIDGDSSTLVYSSAAVPFDTPAGQTIATVGSLFALWLMRQAKKRLVAKKLVVNPVETV